MHSAPLRCEHARARRAWRAPQPPPCLRRRSGHSARSAAARRWALPARAGTVKAPAHHACCAATPTRTAGSKSSATAGSMGTHTRPVLGCTQKGAFSKWFMCFDTSKSRRGKVCANTISCCAARTRHISRAAATWRWRTGCAHQRALERSRFQLVLVLLGRLLNLLFQRRPPQRRIFLRRLRVPLARLRDAQFQTSAVAAREPLHPHLEPLRERLAHILVRDHGQHIVDLLMLLQQPLLR